MNYRSDNPHPNPRFRVRVTPQLSAFMRRWRRERERAGAR